MITLLLDEQLDSAQTVVAHALNAFHLRSGCSFRSLQTEKSRGLEDPEIPGYCKNEGIDALVSFNHKDFGTKIPLYHDLIAAGTSIVVLRPPDKPAFKPERQAALILQHLDWIADQLTDARSPVLLVLTPTGHRQRTLDDIREEFEAKAKLAKRALP